MKRITLIAACALTLAACDAGIPELQEEVRQQYGAHAYYDCSARYWQGSPRFGYCLEASRTDPANKSQ